MRGARFFKWYPLILLVANLVIRSFYLVSGDIGLDEPFTIYHAQFDLRTIVEHLKNYNNPPLYEVVLHFWIKLFGISPLAVRTLPLLFAALSPLVLYQLAKENFSRSVAIYSSLLLTFSTLVQFYAHDCRVYTLFLLLSLSSMYFFLKMIRERRRIILVVFFVVLTTLLIYAHYFGIYIFFFQGLYLLLFYRERIPGFILPYVLIVALYSPQIWALTNRMTDSVSRGTWLQPPAGIENLYNMLWSFSNFPFVTVGCIVLLASAMTKVIRQNGWSFSNPAIALVLIWCFFALIGMFLISYWVPMYIDRYLIYALPAYYIILIVCVEYVFESKKLRLAVSITLLVCFAATINLNPSKNQHVRRVVNLVKEQKDESSLFISCSYDYMTSFAYYFDREAFSDISDPREYHRLDSLLREQHVFFVRSREALEGANLEHFEKVLYLSIYDRCDGNADLILPSLKSEFTNERQYQLGDGYKVLALSKK